MYAPSSSAEWDGVESLGWLLIEGRHAIQFLGGYAQKWNWRKFKRSSSICNYQAILKWEPCDPYPHSQALAEALKVNRSVAWYFKGFVVERFGSKENHVSSIKLQVFPVNIVQFNWIVMGNFRSDYSSTETWERSSNRSVQTRELAKYMTCLYLFIHIQVDSCTCQVNRACAKDWLSCSLSQQVSSIIMG